MRSLLKTIAAGLLLLCCLLSAQCASAQLTGKGVTLWEDGGWCGNDLRFVSDSLALEVGGCENHQSLQAYSYRLLPNGTVELLPVPADQFRPWKGVYRENRVPDSYDSLTGRSFDLAVGVRALLYSEINWNLYIDSQKIASGYQLRELDFDQLTDPRLSVSIELFDELCGSVRHFHHSDFPGEGNVAVIDTWLNWFDFMVELSYRNEKSFGGSDYDRLVYVKGEFFLEKGKKRTIAKSYPLRGY